MLKARVLTALVLVSGFLLAVFLLPPLGWLLFCAVLCGLAGWEWARLARLNSPAAGSYAVLLGGGCLLIAQWLPAPASATFPVPIALLYAASVVFWVAVAPVGLWRGWPLASSPTVLLLLGVLVLWPTGLAIAQLRAVDPLWLLAGMAAVWIADIAAFFAGRRYGRTKLAPAISPGKTREGAYAALCAVTLYGLWVLAQLPYDIDALAWAAWVPLLPGFAVLSIIGDLFESLLKRQAGVKDSGRLLPGHGGVLDRIDSLTSTMPLLALLTLLFRP